MMRTLTMLALGTAVLSASAGDPGDTERRKLCLAHLVCWGSDFINGHDDWHETPWWIDPFPDRPIFCRGFQTNPALVGGRRLQVETAVQYGIDGFAVDVVFARDFVGAMRSIYRAAEGYDFKCVLCIDNAPKAGPDEMIDALRKYAKTYKRHPNSWIDDGKLVMFAYNLGMSPSDWQRVESTLNADPETSIKMLAKTIGEAQLKPSQNGLAMDAVVDGFYDFGCNGFFAEEMAGRLAEGRRMVDRHPQGGLLCAGIAMGYLRFDLGLYRPYLGTESFRNSWEAAIAANADCVCLTTWNDYAESTQFEPSVANRASWLKINREYVRKWRGVSPPPRVADPAISYQEEILDGSDFELEVLSFPYSTAQESVWIRLSDEGGRVLCQFLPVDLPKDEIRAFPLRVNEEEMSDDWRVIRVSLAKVATGSKPDDSDWIELQDVTRRVSRLELPRWARLCLSDLAQPKIRLALDGDTARVTVPGWLNAGDVELVRDGFPVASTGLFHSVSASAQVCLPLPEPCSPFEVFTARFTDMSRCVSFSNPVSRRAHPGRTTTREVVRVGATFDEEWPIWSREIRRKGVRKTERRTVSEDATFALDFILDGRNCSRAAGTQKDVELIRSRSAWKLPLRISNGLWRRDEQLERDVLELTEKTSVSYRSRTFPAWTFCLVFDICPDRTGRSMTLFSEDVCGTRVSLDEQGHVEFSSRNGTVRSDASVPFGSWTRIKAGFDGKALLLSVGEKEIASGPVGDYSRALINSSPLVGADRGGAARYIGRLARFALLDDCVIRKNR